MNNWNISFMAWRSSYKKYPWWKEEILKEVMTPKNHILVKLKKDAVYALSQLDKSLELHFKQPFRKWSCKTFTSTSKRCLKKFFTLLWQKRYWYQAKRTSLTSDRQVSEVVRGGGCRWILYIQDVLPLSLWNGKGQVLVEKIPIVFSIAVTTSVELLLNMMSMVQGTLLCY